jgi:hypothetical protein
MTENDWNVLLSRIQEGRCTPFVGAGVNYGILPLGAEIAQEWATAESFPFKASDDLATVAQFLAVKYKDPMFPKDRMLRRLRSAPRPDFAGPDARLECIRALAALPLPIYLTTNYDDLMLQALRHTSPKKNPRREACRWNSAMRASSTALGGSSSYEPDASNPLVFHLHGTDDRVESLVLTEDDYLDFLVNTSRSPKMIPARIQRALTEASLLFIGYRLRDINFRTLYRGLVESMDGSLRRLSVTVQMTPPDGHSGDPTQAEQFLAQYFERLNVRVYWGTAAQFATELRNRWNQSLAAA